MNYKEIRRAISFLLILVIVLFGIIYFSSPLPTIEKCIKDNDNIDLLEGGNITINNYQLSFGAGANRDFMPNGDSRLRIFWSLSLSNGAIFPKNIDLIHIYAFNGDECWDEEAVDTGASDDVVLRKQIFYGPKWRVDSEISTVAKIEVNNNFYYLLAYDRIGRTE